MAPRRILIIGCSIAGPALACFLLMSDLPATEKPQITVLELAKQVRTEGQNIDIRGAGIALIRKLGLEKVIRASVTGEEGVQLCDDQNQVWASFAADRSGKLRTPTADIEILRGTLARICYERSKDLSEEVKAAGGAGIEYIFGDSLDQINQNGDHVQVHLRNSGETRAYDIVVGADGLQSKTRAMAFGEAGEKDRVHSLGMVMGFFSIPKEETDTEWRRRCNASGGRGLMTRPSEFKDRTTIIASVRNKDPRLLEVASRKGRNVEAQKALLLEYFQDFGWEAPRIMKEMMASKDFYYDVVAQVRMETWSTGRVVLLADAAHCASPLSGMGTTLAFTGAHNLAGALLQHPQDHNAAFEQYRVKMLPTVEKAQGVSPLQRYLLNPQSAWSIWALNRMMSFVQWTGLMQVLFRFVGPPANEVPVEDYGFKDLPEKAVTA